LKSSKGEAQFFFTKWVAATVVCQLENVLAYSTSLVDLSTGTVRVVAESNDLVVRTVVVTENSIKCTSLLLQYLGLPCRPVLAADAIVFLTRYVQFSEGQCNTRWVAKYSQSPTQPNELAVFAPRPIQPIVVVRSQVGHQSMGDVRAELHQMMQICTQSVSRMPTMHKV